MEDSQTEHGNIFLVALTIEPFLLTDEIFGGDCSEMEGTEQRRLAA